MSLLTMFARRKAVIKYVYVIICLVCIILIAIKRYRTCTSLIYLCPSGDFEKNPLVSNSDGRYLPLLKILIDDGMCIHFHSLECI